VVVISPVSRRPPRRSRARLVLLTVVAVLLLLGAAAAAALLAWPDASLAADPVALARTQTPFLAGDVEQLVVRDGSGARVPVHVQAGRIVPTKPVPAGEPLTVSLTVRRPSWAGWLVGHTTRRTLSLRAPAAELDGRWLEVRRGAPLRLDFDAPVRVVALRVNGEQRVVRLSPARRTVSVGVPGRGLATAGLLTVRVAPRPWERLSRSVPVHWFPARKHVQALVEPAPGRTVTPLAPSTLTFSRPLETALGHDMPTLEPQVAGRWRRLDTHTVSFVPSGLGFPLDTHVRVVFPDPVALASPGAEKVTRSLRWETQTGSILRLQQLLAEQGYLPVTWTPTGSAPARSIQKQLAAVADPPAGRFRWPYAATTPKELRGMWKTGEWNAIVRGAVMRFQDTHHLDVDAFVGPQVWQALLADAVAGKRLTDGYSYVYVHRDVPQLLTLWHDGKVILTSPGNTGVPSAPTQLGTFPVFEHIPVGTMSGTNPDGTHYNDPGIRWISYFNHGDALHAFPRASFGTPQSLGCVELPLDAAAKVWPYTPIGTLVTIEH
jgi:peptidoglycan hydrolase-like protein with peptidoglycan-binding domain